MATGVAEIEIGLQYKEERHPALTQISSANNCSCLKGLIVDDAITSTISKQKKNFSQRVILSLEKNQLLSTCWVAYCLFCVNAIFFVGKFTDWPLSWPHETDCSEQGFQNRRMWGETCWFTCIIALAIFHGGNIGKNLLNQKYPFFYLLFTLAVAFGSVVLCPSEYHFELKRSMSNPAAIAIIFSFIVGVMIIAIHLFLARRKGWVYFFVYLSQLTLPIILLVTIIFFMEASPLRNLRKDNSKRVYNFHLHVYHIFGYMSFFCRFTESFVSRIFQCVAVGICMSYLGLYGPKHMFELNIHNIEDSSMSTLNQNYRWYQYIKGPCY